MVFNKNSVRRLTFINENIFLCAENVLTFLPGFCRVFCDHRCGAMEGFIFALCFCEHILVGKIKERIKSQDFQLF